MNTKTLSQPALDTIDQYVHFKVGNAECSVPYFNNKRSPRRAALRSVIGKGSPREIFDEVEILGLRQKIGRSAWTSDLLKKFMCDENIGIDCSGLAYYVLDAESRSRKKGALDRHLAFPGKSFFRKMAAKFRPVENTDVVVFADDENSSPVPLKGIEPGDFISMVGGESARNHILVVTQVDYQNFMSTTVHYINSIAWPEDGECGHGVRAGTIEVLDADKPLTEQKWTEAGKANEMNGTYARAKALKTELRRLKWW